ncbi:tRNA 2-thiouridine(34) synthase MnmA [Hujiaoplasma nucleasis]|uniref:tRNA-specific 2-thiouridylase MnmA n=1 Tax=Hujiaoplasma nucleasis TaxID=2725268 RepID=A0A7L6N0F5_9MOLU|nr:tRNA 2-thiouridine(34) synthase MnmA [Hujiaoplasma nucleasis]QLY39723.1 tRNA 2-thiouridine(34) synthase MnmA [Hujiaoplasma nucleasis]
MKKEKVVVGLSGGVDSAVSAYLLKEQGYEVIGLFMRNWDSAANNDILGNPNDPNDACPQEQDYQDAKRVAEHLGIELHRHDFIQEYWDYVFTYFIEEYKKNRTPNPDILCNKYVKFAGFQEVAKSLGADYFAYGHYARRKTINGQHYLLRGLDQNKDQSYFLSHLNQDQLAKSLFPVGELRKKEVREIAEKMQIPTFDKKDSTGICFIGERNFREFLKNYIFTKPGDIESTDGDILGRHEGLMYYTIGQRKGLEIGGHKDYPNAPWFVIGKDIERNVLLVGQGKNHPLLFANRVIVEDVHWISKDKFTGTLECQAKFRYRQADQTVIIKWINDRDVEVISNHPIKAVTPGQAAVFYQDEVCLGGGVIKASYQNQKKLMY